MNKSKTKASKKGRGTGGPQQSEKKLKKGKRNDDCPIKPGKRKRWKRLGQRGEKKEEKKHSQSSGAARSHIDYQGTQKGKNTQECGTNAKKEQNPYERRRKT